MQSKSSANRNTVNSQNAKQYLSENIIFPEHIEIVSAESFRRKNNIRSVKFPKNIRLIGADAFRECCALEEVLIPADSPLTTIRQSCFTECFVLSSLSLPNALEEIEGRAFFHCKKLSDVTFPDKLRKIGAHAFAFCPLKSLELPDSLEIIEEAAFFKCNFLLTVTIPKNVKHIGNQAFRGCNRLRYLEFYHDPETIGEEIINRAVTIRCYKNSYVATYCKERDLQVEYFE